MTSASINTSFFVTSGFFAFLVNATSKQEPSMLCEAKSISHTGFGGMILINFKGERTDKG